VLRFWFEKCELRLVCRVALLVITLARHEGREEDVGSVVGGMMKVLV